MSQKKERHNTGNFAECSYIWLPIQIHDNNTLHLEYRKRWKIGE